MNNTCYIYGLRSKDSDRFFYIGSTKLSPEWRWVKHQEHFAAGRNRNMHLVRTVQLLGAENVVCQIIEEVSAAKRFEREAHWIGQFSGLTNIVKNPAAQILRDPLPTVDEIESAIAKTKLIQDPIAALVVRYAETAVLTLRSIEKELHARAIQ